jgi:hypothetical protein
MNITLLLFAACSIILPASMTAQELSRAPLATDSGTIGYARTKANRVGITADTIEQPLRIRNDSADSGAHIIDRLRHTSIGGFWGTLGGAAIGAGIGAWADAHTNDGMIPATAILGIYGAIGGLALGLLSGAVWPVR